MAAPGGHGSCPAQVRPSRSRLRRAFWTQSRAVGLREHTWRRDGRGAHAHRPGTGPRATPRTGSVTRPRRCWRPTSPDPLAQFERWYADAVAAGVREPNAMVLATVGAGGAPSARTVLLKQADARGFVFYTNYGSRKAAEIGAGGPGRAGLPVARLFRQVGVRGLAERVAGTRPRPYFRQRPWGSRIGAWASRQSAPPDGPRSPRGALGRAGRALARPGPARRRPGAGPLGRLRGPPGRGRVLAGPPVPAARPAGVRAACRRWPGRVGAAAALDDPAAWRVERRQP